MKSSKLIDIFKNGNIVIPIFFLRHYQDWKLEMDEFVFLMYFYHLGDRFLLNPNQYASEINLDLEKVMGLIDKLTEKGFIRVDVVKNEKGLREEMISLEPFYEKITLLTMDEVNQEKKDDSSIFETIEKEFGRTLSPMEYEIIRAWLDNNIKEEVIVEAVREATMNGVSNLRYIDKILYEWGKAGIDSKEAVDAMRKKRNKKEDKDSNIDLGIVDWKWFDEEE